MFFHRRTDFTITSTGAGHYLAFVLALLFLAQVNPTQGQAQQKEDQVRIVTDLIQLDVVVTDAQGRLVRDLKSDDFTLLEDGRPQQITHFTTGTAARQAMRLSIRNNGAGNSAGAVSVAPERGQERFVVLAVDDFHLKPANLLTVRQALVRFINEQTAENDQTALVTTSGNPGLYQQFTRERAVLERAINRIGIRQQDAGDNFDLPRITEYQAELIEMGDRDALELAAIETMAQAMLPENPPSGNQGSSGRSGGRQQNRSGSQGVGGNMTPRERAEEMAKTRARMILAQSTSNTAITLQNLENVIRSLRDLPGRKIVVLFSDGFLLGSGAYAKHADLPRITDAATRSGVVIYSLDTRGLLTVTPDGEASAAGNISSLIPGERTRVSAIRARLAQSEPEARRDALVALAHSTGGLTLFNNNDFNLSLQRVLDDNEFYYLLAYAPELSPRDGRFHEIEVRVKDRLELKVRTRRGYFAPGMERATKESRKAPDKKKEPTANEAETQLHNALRALVPLRELPLTVAADFIDLPESGTNAVINARIEAADLNPEKNGNRFRTVLDVLVGVFDERGNSVASLMERIDLDLTPERLAQIRRFGINYRKLLPLRDGAYQVRLAVREQATARTGSNFDWVEIPSLKDGRLTLSSIFLTASQNASLPVTGSDGKSQAGYEVKEAQVTRRFSRDGVLDFMLIAYNGARAGNVPDLIIQAQVFASGRLLQSSPLSLMMQPGNSDPQRVPYAAQFPLQGFAPGAYELRLIVTDRAGKVSASRSINFIVE